jgi:chromosome partitioning protein
VARRGTVTNGRSDPTKQESGNTVFLNYSFAVMLQSANIATNAVTENQLKILAIANQKGGSGKTTTAVSLAAALAERGRRVLLVDLDQQGNASTWLGHTDGGEDLLNVFLGMKALASTVRESGVENLSIIPTSRIFAKADLALVTDPDALFVLRREISRFDETAFDYMIFDCPPTLGIVTTNALVAADSVVVPTEPTSLSTTGVANLFETIARLRETHNPELDILGILLCRYDGRTRLTRDIEDKLLTAYADLILPRSIRQNVRIAEAHAFRQPITTYDPTSAASADYRAVAEIVEARAGRED